jgi:hypothetical protein
VTFGGIRLELGLKKNGVDFRYVIEKSLIDFMARKNAKPMNVFSPNSDIAQKSTKNAEYYRHGFFGDQKQYYADIKIGYRNICNPLSQKIEENIISLSMDVQPSKIIYSKDFITTLVSIFTVESNTENLTKIANSTKDAAIESTQTSLSQIGQKKNYFIADINLKSP